MERKGYDGSSVGNGVTIFSYTLESYQDVLVDLEAESQRDLAVPPALIWYSPLLSGSLYTCTPREEIGLLADAMVYDGQGAGEGFVDMVLGRWGLSAWADVHFHELSGGFRKLVFVATQVEARRKGEAVVVVNVQQQLDALRLQIVEARLEEIGVKAVLWVDDNPSLLLKKVAKPVRCQTLRDWRLEWASICDKKES